MKPYACVPVCLLLSLIAVFTRSPAVSAFSLYLGSGGNYGDPSHSLEPQGDILHEAWPKPFPDTFWRRRRRGVTSRSPSGRRPASGLGLSPWSLNPNDVASQRRMAKLQSLTVKYNRLVHDNDVLSFQTPSKLFPADSLGGGAEGASSGKKFAGNPFGKPFKDVRDRQKIPAWGRPSARRPVFPDEQQPPSNSAWDGFEEASEGEKEEAAQDLDAVDQEMQDVLEAMEDSERSQAPEKVYGSNAELPAGPVPPITLFPAPERIPSRPAQGEEDPRGQTRPGSLERTASLLQTGKLDSNEMVAVVNKAAESPVHRSGSQNGNSASGVDLDFGDDFGTWLLVPKTAVDAELDPKFQALFEDPTASTGKGEVLFPSYDSYGFLGGQFDDDTSDCADIETKSCLGDWECSCNGFYHCQAGRCALRSQPHPSDLSGSVGDFSDLGGVWLDAPAEIHHEKRRDASPVGSASATTAGSREARSTMDRSGKLQGGKHYGAERKAPADLNGAAVQEPRASFGAGQSKVVKRRALTGTLSSSASAGQSASETNKFAHPQ